MKKILKKIVKPLIVFLCFAALIAGSRYLYLEYQGNFHPITAGEAYRSAQLNPVLLEEYITQYGIKSIINLRGTNDTPWYHDEIAVSKKMNVQHYDLALSARSTPATQRITDLLNIFETAPRPVLIHCMAGADRSGLAAALWKVVIDKEPKVTASEQLSILYGHVPFGPTQAMDNFFEQWQAPKE